MANGVILYCPEGGILIRGRYRDEQGNHLEPLFKIETATPLFPTQLDMKVFGITEDTPVVVVHGEVEAPARRYLASRTSFVFTPEDMMSDGEALDHYMAEKLAEGVGPQEVVDIPDSSSSVRADSIPTGDILGYLPEGLIITGTHQDSRHHWVEPIIATDHVFFEPSNEVDQVVLGCAEGELVIVVWSEGTERYRLSRDLSFYCLKEQDRDHIEERLHQAANSRYPEDEDE